MELVQTLVKQIPSPPNAQSAFGGLGSFQTAGGNIAQGAAGMTGPQAYQPFMSPYQSQVIDATLAEYDKQGAAGSQAIKDQAVASGNFGGGREGAMLGQYESDRLADSPNTCLLYTSPSPRDGLLSRMPSSA